MTHPYGSLPPRAFWRPAVSNRHFLDMEDVAEPLPIAKEDRFGTAGSCFAQHMSRHLKAWGANFLDLEPAPGFIAPEEAAAHGYGIYSCRYGNIYTARQLLQLAQEACGLRTPQDAVWSNGGRFYDALRPLVDPVGHATAEDVVALRAAHLRKVRALLESVDVFVFTQGLTEAWESVADGTVYPSAPGVVAGEYDPKAYRVQNFTHKEIRRDLLSFWRLLRSLNPKAKLVLTVSPVPITATASGRHVLSATTYTKCTLRSVAGELSDSSREIFYFPGYELVASHPARAMFFNPDMRTINTAGVAFVLKHFAAAVGRREAADAANSADANSGGASNGPGEPLICDEALIEGLEPDDGKLAAE